MVLMVRVCDKFPTISGRLSWLDDNDLELDDNDLELDDNDLETFLARRQRPRNDAPLPGTTMATGLAWAPWGLVSSSRHLWTRCGDC